MGLVDVTPNLRTLKRQLGFLWASEMAPDTAARLPLPFSQAVLEASEKSTVFVRQLLQSSASAVLNGRGEFLS